MVENQKSSLTVGVWVFSAMAFVAAVGFASWAILRKCVPDAML